MAPGDLVWRAPFKHMGKAIGPAAVPLLASAVPFFLKLRRYKS